MALPGFLYRNLAAGLTPTADSSTPDVSFPWSNLSNPQPRMRVRITGTSAIIIIDLGSIQSADCWALISTSLPRTTGVRVRASATNPLVTGSTNLDTGTVSDDFTDPQYNGNVVMCFATTAARFWRMDLSGAVSPIDFGILMLGLLFRPENATEYGVQEGFIDLSIRDMNEDTGAEFALSGPKKKTLQFTMAGTEAEVRGFTTSFSDMDRVVGASGDVLFVENSAADALTCARDSVYGAYREIGASLATRVANELWTRVFQLRERR